MLHYRLPDIIDFFLKKFKDATVMLAVRSLLYFEDADSDFEPKCFFKYNWENIKKTIKAEVKKL